MKIIVLGPGCDKCRYTKKLIEEVLAELKVTASVTLIEDMREILNYAVMMTPAVIIDDEEVIIGKVPSREQVIKWISDRKG